jgi:two-component system nitrogen regulation response regulator GlnG
LTILYHPEESRVGEVSRLLELLDGRGCDVSRSEPRFGPPNATSGSPLGDRYLSRRPLRLTKEPTGYRLSPSSGLQAVVDGQPLEGPRDLSAADLDRGLVITLADRVVLLLHQRGLKLPRQPRLGMVGESEALERLRLEILRVADLTVPLLVRGESGSGKELAARAIGGLGPRAQGPFVGVNMAAIPSSLAASELFGHSSGAYTGATKQHTGHFLQAHGGTLFLDEIGEAPLDVQAMLLRVLETSEIQPLGSIKPQKVDVRVIAATDQDLEEAVRKGTFRDALYHRLAGYRIDLPPLRKRRDDFGRLLFHFLRKELTDIGEEKRLGQLAEADPWLPASVVARLAAYHWPGNVRELVNVARRLVVASRGGEQIGLESIASTLMESPSRQAPPEAPDDAEESSSPGGDPGLAPSEIGEGKLLEALGRNAWDVTATARHLGISRTSLYVLMDASPNVRKAKDLSAEEIRSCAEEHAGELKAMAQALRVSLRGLRLRLKDLDLQL